MCAKVNKILKKETAQANQKLRGSGSRCIMLSETKHWWHMGALAILGVTRCNNKLLFDHRCNIQANADETKTILDTCTTATKYLIIDETAENKTKYFVVIMSTHCRRCLCRFLWCRSVVVCGMQSHLQTEHIWTKITSRDNDDDRCQLAQPFSKYHCHLWNLSQTIEIGCRDGGRIHISYSCRKGKQLRWDVIVDISLMTTFEQKSTIDRLTIHMNLQEPWMLSHQTIINHWKSSK